MNDTRALTLVLGATGKTGRRVAERLRRAGRPVRLGSRAGTPPFDWHIPGTWSAALQGAQAVYVTYQPDLAFPGAEERLRAFASCAADAGVGHMVLLSGRGSAGARRSEAALAGAKVPVTVLRSAFFFQNFSEGSLLPGVRDGQVAFPAGEVAEAFIDAEDIADVAVAALTDARHQGRVYELTGPHLLTFPHAVRLVAEATGRPLSYLPVSLADYGAALAPFMPEQEAAFWTALFAEVLGGRNAHVTGDVERALGRAPRAFFDYARHTAAGGIWS